MKQKLDVISIRVPDVELASGADFYKTYFPNYFADGVLTFEPFQLINHYVNINQSYILQEKRKNKNDENLEAFKPCSDNHSSIDEGEMYAFNDQCYDEELMAIHVIKKLLEAYIIKDISKNCMFNSILQKDMRSIYDFININRQRAHRAYKSFHAMDSAEQFQEYVLKIASDCYIPTNKFQIDYDYSFNIVTSNLSFRDRNNIENDLLPIYIKALVTKFNFFEIKEKISKDKSIGLYKIFNQGKARNSIGKLEITIEKSNIQRHLLLMKYQGLQKNSTIYRQLLCLYSIG